MHDSLKPHSRLSIFISQLEKEKYHEIHQDQHQVIVLSVGFPPQNSMYQTKSEPGTSGPTANLCPPPSDSNEKKAPVVEELGRFAFECMAYELKSPADQEKRQRVEPQAMNEKTSKSQAQ
jgi:hypothetical protein